MLPEKAKLRVHLDRSRDLLVASGDLSPIRRDLDLHLLSLGLSHAPLIHELLLEGLAAISLYIVSRPRFESFGWTIHLESPLLNLFVTGSAKERTVVGRAFTDEVQSKGKNLLYAQIVRPFGELQTSSADVEANGVFEIVEEYCRKSDQQPVRLAWGDADDAALVTALPEGDRAWLLGVPPDKIIGLSKAADLKLVSEHELSFRCGCDAERIVALIAGAYRDAPEDLFRGDDAVEVGCPRCAAKYEVARESFDAWIRSRGGGR